MPRRAYWPLFNISAAGIRTKILVPLVMLMIVSMMGGTLGFIISTNTTRNSILDRQLVEDGERLNSALMSSSGDTIEAARLLARDEELQNAMRMEQEAADENQSLAMAERVVPLRDRLDIDQVIVLDNTGQARVNVAPLHLESISVNGRHLLPKCSETVQADLVEYYNTRLFIACAPIDPVGAPGQPLMGNVYTVLDIDSWLIDIKPALDLTAEVDLRYDLSLFQSSAAPGQHVQDDAFSNASGYRMQHIWLPIGDDHVPFELRMNEQGINAILNSGLRVTLITSLVTVVLVLAVGMWLARQFTRPILKLADVAASVAAGDLSRRANLRHDDEIGRLGRTFDKATETISDLLHQQARTAGERQAILHSIADGVLAVDTEERIILMNPAAAALLKYDAQAAVGQPLSSLTATDNPHVTQIVGLERIVAQVRSELTDADMAPTEDVVSLEDRIVRVHSTPTLVSDSTRTGAVVVLQDVTRAVEADQAKNAFIATASHELRTPLASLKGFVDIFNMTGTGNLDENQQMFLDAIKRQTETMVELVNNLLEVARLEQGVQRVEKSWVRVPTAVESALGNIHGLVTRREVQVVADMPDTLPSLWIDPSHLRSILVNLFSNAAKYVYQGGTIRIYAYELQDADELPGPPYNLPWPHNEERSLIIAVEDDGVGIRASDQAKIFERFFRSENPLSVEVGGTGLGLSIVRSLVELHEGQIGFWSVENQGSCFWVRLPTPSTEPLSNKSVEHQLQNQAAS